MESASPNLGPQPRGGQRPCWVCRWGAPGWYLRGGRRLPAEGIWGARSSAGAVPMAMEVDAREDPLDVGLPVFDPFRSVCVSGRDEGQGELPWRRIYARSEEYQGREGPQQAQAPPERFLHLHPPRMLLMARQYNKVSLYEYFQMQVAGVRAQFVTLQMFL